MRLHRPILFTLLLLGSAACKKEHPVPVTDACTGSPEVTADFHLLEGVAGFVTDSESDTMYTYNTVHFEAVETSAHYQWIVDGEYISNERSFYRYYDNEYDWQTIPVKLIVQKSPDLTCNPTDDGADTLTKFLTLVPRTDAIHAEGIFRVKADFMSDSMDVTVNYEFCQQTSSGTCFTITNYDGAGSVILNPTTTLYYRQILFGQSAVPETFGYIKVHSGKPVEIFTRIAAPGFPTQEIRSLGRKL